MSEKCVANGHLSPQPKEKSDGDVNMQVSNFWHNRNFGMVIQQYLRAWERDASTGITFSLVPF
jgi:hypothetical protein